MSCGRCKHGQNKLVLWYERDRSLLTIGCSHLRTHHYQQFLCLQVCKELYTVCEGGSRRESDVCINLHSAKVISCSLGGHPMRVQADTFPEQKLERKMNEAAVSQMEP